MYVEYVYGGGTASKKVFSSPKKRLGKKETLYLIPNIAQGKSKMSLVIVWGNVSGYDRRSSGMFVSYYSRTWSTRTFSSVPRISYLNNAKKKKITFNSNIFANKSMIRFSLKS